MKRKGIPLFEDWYLVPVWTAMIALAFCLAVLVYECFNLT